MIKTRNLLLIGAVLMSYLGYSQDNKLTITFPKDSLSFYMNKYKDISKAIKVAPIKSMRVSYVYLDGSKLTLDEINKLRKKIISDYKKGKSFAELANLYTMDGVKDGDIGWFDSGMMVKVFEDEIKNHKKGNIFTVDIPENKWYYVVLKTFNDTEKIQMEIEKNN